MTLLNWRTAVNKMLTDEPVGAPMLWKSLIPLDVVILKDFYARADPDRPELDLQDIKFSSWVNEDGLQKVGKLFPKKDRNFTQKVSK